MSTLKRKLVFCIIGLLSGLAAWPLAELILMAQPWFPSYLVFSICLGMVFGAVMGGFLGSSEGITLTIKPKIMPGIITGALVGVVGGAFGFLIGQGALFISGSMIFHSNKMQIAYGIPISRAVGWACLGMFIGIVEGVRARSWVKIQVGLVGGLIGGLLGGIVLEYFRIYIEVVIIARLIGLSILGLMIGLFYGLFEKRFSRGIFRLLNGKLKGKEYLLVQRNIDIGTAETADIHLLGYKRVSDIHAKMKIKKGEIYISSLDSKNQIKVNEKKVKEHQLKLDDVVQIGSAKFLFSYN